MLFKDFYIKLMSNYGTNTPDMFEIMNVLGKENIIKRFEKAINE